MIKIKNIFKLALAFLICAFATAQEKEWSLQESVEYALENNITVQQSLIDQKIAEQDLKSAKGNFLPTVNGSGSQSWNFGSFIDPLSGGRIAADSRGNSFGLNTGITLFNGFRNINIKKQAALGVESSKIQLDILKNNISLNVVNAYLNILFNKEAVKQAKDQVDVSKESLSQVEELVNSGVRARADLLVSKSQLATDNERLVNAQNSVDLSLLSLAQLLQTPSEGFEIEDVNIDLAEAVLIYKDSNKIVSYAIENRPEIKGAQLNIDNAELNYQIARSAYYPTFSFGVGANTNYQHRQGQKDILEINRVFDPVTFQQISSDIIKNGFFPQLENNLGYNVGFNLSIPIFNGFKTDASLQRAKLSKERILLSLEQEKQTLKTNIEQAYADAKASLLQYESSKLSLESQELAYENEQDKYDLGVSTSFQLEQVRNRLINAQSSFLNAKYNFVFKTKVLDFYLDKPITQ